MSETPNPQFSFAPDPAPEPRARDRRVGSKLLLAMILIALPAAAGLYMYLYEPEHVRNVLGNTPLAPAATVTQTYKWRGADGGWNLTSEPPAPGVDYEVVTVRSDTNVLPALGTD